MKIAYYSLFSLCLLLSFNIQAQTFSDYKWDGEMPKAAEIPEKFKDADAVIIKSSTKSNNVFTGSFPQIDQLATYEEYQHIKFMSEDAVEDYKRLSIPKFKGRIGDFVQMKYVDIRIRKKDGSVQDLKVRDLSVPELDEEEKKALENNYIYEIEGLEVGDEMERITVIESKFPDQGRIVNLYNNYPTLEASFTIAIPTSVKLNGREYNGMPRVDLKNTGEQFVYRWKMENLKAVPEANTSGTIITNELEHFVYELNFDGLRPGGASFTIGNFSDLIWQYAEDFVDVRIRSKKKVRQFYEDLFAEGAKVLKKEPEQLSKLEKAYLMNNFMVKELKMIGRLEDFERSEGIDYFLSNKKADYSNLMCIYRDFFERNGIKYYLAVGKSRFNGPFDVQYPSSTQISSYLFVFEDDKGNNWWMTPTGGLNELPASLQSTSCLMKDLSDRKSELKSITFSDEALKNAKDNKRMRRVQVQVEKDGSLNIKGGSTLSGLCSTSGRNFWATSNKEGKDSIQVRLERSYNNRFETEGTTVAQAAITQFDILPPYNFKTNYQIAVPKAINIEDGKMVFNAKDWLGHNVRWVSNAEKRTLDYHNDFIGSDVEEIFLVFPYDVEVEGMDDLKQSVETHYASYELEVAQMKPNMIRIKSTYKTKILELPADKAMEQQKVNEAWEKANDAKWVIKKK
jgi:hypothetical protein